MWPIRKHGEQYHAANWVNASAPSLTLRLITDFTQPSLSDIRPSDSPATEVVTNSAEPPLILQRAKERNGDITEAQRACRNRKKNFEELKRIYRCDRPSSAIHSSQQREKLKLPRVPLFSEATAHQFPVTCINRLVRKARACSSCSRSSFIGAPVAIENWRAGGGEGESIETSRDDRAGNAMLDLKHDRAVVVAVSWNTIPPLRSAPVPIRRPWESIPWLLSSLGHRCSDSLPDVP